MAAKIAVVTVYMFNDDLYPRSPILFTFSQFYPQSTYRDRGEIGGMSLSAGAYTTTLYVMVDIVKEGWHASPTLTSIG
jgi:hypothetical protein